MSKKTFLLCRLLACGIVLLIALTGCYDGVEIENRGMVISMGIDKNSEGQLELSLALPNPGAMSGKGGDAENKWVKQAAAQTITEAINLIDSESSQKLYLGHTKLIVFGRNALKDKQLVREAFDALERNRELSRKVAILATDKSAADILSAETKDQPMVGMFITSYYKNNRHSLSKTFLLDLETCIRGLRFDRTAVLPLIKLKDKELELNGAVVVKDFKQMGELDDQQTRGFLYGRGFAEGSVIVAEHKEADASLSITKCKRKFNFTQSKEQTLCTIQIDVEGEVDGFTFANEVTDDITKLNAEYEEKIREDVAAVVEQLKSINADGLDLRRNLWKNGYKDVKLLEIETDVSVSVNIKGTGTIY